MAIQHSLFERTPGSKELELTLCGFCLDAFEDEPDISRTE